MGVCGSDTELISRPTELSQEQLSSTPNPLKTKQLSVHHRPLCVLNSTQITLYKLTPETYQQVLSQLRPPFPQLVSFIDECYTRHDTYFEIQLTGFATRKEVQQWLPLAISLVSAVMRERTQGQCMGVKYERNALSIIYSSCTFGATLVDCRKLVKERAKTHFCSFFFHHELLQALAEYTAKLPFFVLIRIDSQEFKLEMQYFDYQALCGVKGAIQDGNDANGPNCALALGNVTQELLQRLLCSRELQSSIQTIIDYYTSENYKIDRNELQMSDFQLEIASALIYLQSKGKYRIQLLSDGKIVQIRYCNAFSDSVAEILQQIHDQIEKCPNRQLKQYLTLIMDLQQVYDVDFVNYVIQQVQPILVNNPNIQQFTIDCDFNKAQDCETEIQKQFPAFSLSLIEGGIQFTKMQR